MKHRKTLVVDTSVLLYDKESIHSFSGCDVVIPLVVLDELDRFKEKPGILGESARYVNRFLDFLRTMGRLDEGVLIEEEDQTVRVLISHKNIPTGLDGTKGDNQIIEAALSLQKSKEKQSQVKVITKDINLRVKCDALGLEAEDYFKDHIKNDKLYDEENKILNVSDSDIDALYSEGLLEIESPSLNENEFVILNGDSQGKSALCIHKKSILRNLPERKGESTDVKPRNKEQKFAWHVLNDDS